VFHEVLDSVLQLYPDLVKLASNEISDTIYGNDYRWPFFQDCIGALDGSHFLLHVPSSERTRFRNWHADISQNVLAAVDFDMNFTYVLAGGRVARTMEECSKKL
jgi:hypothetical protein